MPVVFAQPEQDYTRSHVSGGGGGGNSVASAMADIAAQKAQYADRFANAEMQQQANIVGAQIQAHAAAQERAAQLEIQGWMQRQAFTRSDQQELIRQQNALSELQTRYDNGEISEPEFYKMLGTVAPRVNYLTFKEQHTTNQALAEQRKALAEKNMQLAELRAAQAKHASGTFEDNFRFQLDQTQHARLAQELRDSSMDMRLLEQQNPAEFEKRVRQRGEDQGAGQWWSQRKVGEWTPVEGQKPARTSASTAAKPAPPPKDFSAVTALHSAEAVAKAEGLDKETPEFKKRVEEVYKQQKEEHAQKQAEWKAKTPEGQAQAKLEIQQKAIQNNMNTWGEFQNLPGLSPEGKQASSTLLGIRQGLIERHGAYEHMPKDLKAKMDEIARALKKIYDSAGQENRVVAETK